MSKRKTAHVISHSHWDREWYLPLEKHRYRLVQLMDDLIEIIETDPDFKSFHLDGQTIILEDYFQIRPDRREQVARYIEEGRLHIGPWYILQDEFLTSSEANVRNLLYGLKDARPYGKVSKVGYFPDSFGNMGQAAQILRQAGIECAVFGRGVKPTGFNNSVEDSDSFQSPYSEMWWESPDGSRVLGILFANWYNNAMDIPVDEEEAASYWNKKLADAGKYASSSELLFMNGCDHTPVQMNVSEALRMARRLHPEVEFVHSSFNEYIDEVTKRVPEDLSVIRGELRSQRTHGWGTLVNTASARVYLKQANQQGQALLERSAEPLAAIASTLEGYAYPHHWFEYAWKTLMQNHPHDSICGCSIDEVHREMMTRFAKSRQVAEEIVDAAVRHVANAIDTSSFEDAGGVVPFIVFNTSGVGRTGSVTLELTVAKQRLIPDQREAIFAELEALPISSGVVMNAAGERVPFEWEDLGVHFDYELPSDRFRIRYVTRRIRLTLEAKDVPTLGYRTYVWKDGTAAAQVESSPLTVKEHVMENARLIVDIAEDGSLAITDKTTGHTFRDGCVYEDTGDIGNEYIYRQPVGEQAITTKGSKAEVRLVKHTPVCASFEIVHRLELPVGSDDTHECEKRRMVPPVFDFRKGQRSGETVTIVIRTLVTLERNGRSVDIRTSVDNQARDHRLRVLFPTDVDTDTHTADSIFELAVRDNEPAPEWSNPSNCQHQQAFVDVGGDSGGLTIATKGLHEYEVLRDGRHTIAVTLLRAVSELGDWGVFPTPEAQCLGEHTFEYSLIPHAGGESRWEAYQRAYQFQTPWQTVQTTIHAGNLPAECSYGIGSGNKLTLSSFKRNEETNDLIVRWFNMSGEEGLLELRSSSRDHGELYSSNIIEERSAKLNPEAVQVHVRPAEIVTIAAAKKKEQ